MNDTKPVKNIQWGNLQLTEWEKPYQDKTIKSFSLSCRIYNRDTKKSETESSVQLDKREDLSIVSYLLKKAITGKYEVVNQYSLSLEEDKLFLSKEYETKDGQKKKSTLILNHKGQLLQLNNLVDRSINLLIIPFKNKKIDSYQNSSFNNAEDQEDDVVGIIDDEVPF